ncbi:MAG: DUF721 domain-containing protein [Myxococcales bacterium]
MARLFGDPKPEEPVYDILSRVLRKRKISPGLAPVPLRAWTDAVGPSLSARTRPTALSRGVLHVAVQDHRWRDQIDASRALIVRRLNALLGAGTVRSLQFGPLAAEAVHRALERPDFAGTAPHDVNEAFARAARAAERRRA